MLQSLYYWSRMKGHFFFTVFMTDCKNANASWCCFFFITTVANFVVLIPAKKKRKP